MDDPEYVDTALMNFPHGETVTLLAPGTIADPYSGDTADDWTTLTETPIHGVAVEPRPSQEPVQDARNAVTSGYTLYVPAGAQIAPRDRVRVRGEVYSILGEPAEWISPFTGWTPGIVVQVGRTDG